ncbi:MAG: CsbD family protein, partial [Pseudomonas sp.]
MNSDVIKGKWKQLNGRIKERWGNLTDDDVDVVEGHSEYLAGKLQ